MSLAISVDLPDPGLPVIKILGAVCFLFCHIRMAFGCPGIAYHRSPPAHEVSPFRSHEAIRKPVSWLFSYLERTLNRERPHSNNQRCRNSDERRPLSGEASPTN